MRAGNQSANPNPGFPSRRALAEVLTCELGPNHTARWSLSTNGRCRQHVGWTWGCTRVSSAVKGGSGRTEMGGTGVPHSPWLSEARPGLRQGPMRRLKGPSSLHPLPLSYQPTPSSGKAPPPSVDRGVCCGGRAGSPTLSEKDCDRQRRSW